MTDPMDPTPFDPDDETQEMIKGLVTSLGDNARKLGLYLEGVGVMSHVHDDDNSLAGVQNAQSFKDQIRNGEANVVIAATFIVGDVAWDKRTLDPEQDKIDREVRSILPDPVQELREKILRAKAEGKDILDIDNLDGDDD